MGAQIVFDGDSMTVGDYAWANPAWRTIEKLCLAGQDISHVHNDAVTSETVADMDGDAPTNIDPLFDGVTYSANICVLFGGTNDLVFGASAATVISRIEDYCANRQAEGWLVVVNTILPRSNVGTPGTFNADRATINASIVANWANYADALADVAASAIIGDNGDEASKDYYYDLVHLNRNGWDVVSDIWKVAIESLL